MRQKSCGGHTNGLGKFTRGAGDEECDGKQFRTIRVQEKERIRKEKAQDEETKKMYGKYIYEAYMEKRNHIVGHINAEASPEDKMIWVLCLGLLDEDYERTKITIGEKQEIA